MDDSLRIILICVACCCGLAIVGVIVWFLILYVFLPMPSYIPEKIPLQPIEIILSSLKLI